MAYIGDFRVGDTFDTKFCTVTTTGAPTTLAGTPVISAYPGNSTTQLTAGITLSVDFDSVTGLNNVRVVATGGNGYVTATNYQLVITTGTVGGVSVVGYVVAEFSLEARSAVMPTTAARTLDVSAGGEAGVDWANVGTPGSTVGLSATTVATVTTTATATAVTTVNGLAANTVTASALATDAVTEIADGVWNSTTSGHATVGTFGQLGQIPRASTATAGAAGTITLDASASAVDDFYNDQLIVITSGTGANQARQITDYVGSTKVATISPNWATNPANGSVFAILPVGAAASVASIAGAVWDIVLASHVTAGSTGAALNAAGGAGDPWITALPGAYAAGSAGHIVGTALPDIAPGSANGLLRGGTNAATSITTALTANVIGNITGALSGAVGSVAGAVGSVTGAVGSVSGAVGSVTGNVGGNVTGSVGSVAANGLTASSLATDAVTEIVSAVFARAFGVAYGSFTFEQIIEIMAVALAGKASGGATATATYRNLADSANVIVATVDASGNRTAVTLTP